MNESLLLGRLLFNFRKKTTTYLHFTIKKITAENFLVNMWLKNFNCKKKHVGVFSNQRNNVI